MARDDKGRALAVVDRTNNVIEEFFASAKQGLRRGLGRAHLGRDMEDQPAQTALAANLRHPDYVHILCGHWTNCPKPSPGWTAKNAPVRPACSARTEMRNYAHGIGRGPRTPDGARL